MANKRVTDLNPIATAPVSGVMHFIDTTDSTQNAAGSSFKVTKEDFLKENTAAILLNTAKVSFTDSLVASSPAVVVNTGKVGITTGQASAIVDNTAKILLKANTLDVVAQNGGTIYTNTKTFVPTGTFSSVGTTVTITGSQLSSSMVGSKIGLENDRRIIVSFTNSNQVVVDSAFSENYTVIISANWGVFCNVLFVDSSGNIILKTGKNDTGSRISILRGDNSSVVDFYDNKQAVFFGSIQVPILVSQGNVAFKNGKVVVGNGSNVGFSGGDWNGSVDTAISRLSSGLLELNTGTTGNRTQLALGKILVNVAVDNGVDSARVNGSLLATTIKTSGFTVATLPSPPAQGLGAIAHVTDALNPTYLGTLTGGGTVKCPVFYNGTNWVSS